MFNIGGSELLLILLAALLLLGPARIPGFVRGAARWYREFMKMKEQVDASLSEIREEIEKEGQPVKQVATELEGIRRHALPKAQDIEKPAAEAVESTNDGKDADSASSGRGDNAAAGAAALIRPPEGRTLAKGSLAAESVPPAPAEAGSEGEQP